MCSKMERKTGTEQMKNVFRDIETMKKKNTHQIQVSEINNSLYGFTNRLETIEEKTVNVKTDQQKISNVKNREKNYFKI